MPRFAGGEIHQYTWGQLGHLASVMAPESSFGWLLPASYPSTSHPSKRVPLMVLRESFTDEHGAPERIDEAIGLALVRVQRQLESIYQLEPAPAIAPFVRVGAANSREEVLVRQSPNDLELVVVLPEASLDALLKSDPMLDDMDSYLGGIEGISHFIHLAERARTDLPTTLLELELQAEVDKFAILADRPALPAPELEALHRRLYADVRYLHTSQSELGQRYRLANDLAARLWSYLIRAGQSDATRGLLRRFYRASQAEKIRMVRAA
jgi:hypothetical protein